MDEEEALYYDVELSVYRADKKRALELNLRVNGQADMARYYALLKTADRHGTDVESVLSAEEQAAELGIPPADVLFMRRISPRPVELIRRTSDRLGIPPAEVVEAWRGLYDRELATLAPVWIETATANRTLFVNFCCVVPAVFCLGCFLGKRAAGR